MSEENKRLHNSLIKLGDMMGDGLHLEPGGKWISKEYNSTLRALGMLPKKKRNTELINKSVKAALDAMPCECGGKLVQSRKGTYSVHCECCKNKFKLRKVKKWL